MSAANRRRGADCERQVIRWLKENGWPDARRTLAGDGHQPGDVDFEPGIHLEVKDRVESRWPGWRAQAVNESHGRVPIVLRRSRGITDVGRWRCQVRLFDWPPPLFDDRTTSLFCTRTSCTWFDIPFADIAAWLLAERAATEPRNPT